MSDDTAIGQRTYEMENANPKDNNIAFMPTYYITFTGGMLINAKTPQEALDQFAMESTGDNLLDAIDESEIYSASNGRIGDKITLTNPD